ncbi:hypothetical protein [Pontibacter chinhatensis]|uniref:Uncharacterized protein n=1 Tax=Pontibacter chinhatensis TaxID=1436961 RepID=A0A1I2LS33_9BACT|nr:hypothetical protein [Pontibacter chinhatensis]SFF82272.1 hypothetical protein SAMN05421739_10117 [Pontibacter chinhatensis]
MRASATHVTLVLGFILFTAVPGLCQVKPYLTARVDTTKQEVKAVYELIGNYLNAQPDSLYHNPYWNKEEVDFYYGQHQEHFDQAAPHLFFGLNSKQLFSYFKPTVLSIEPVGEKYVARILLATDKLEPWMVTNKMNPPFILRYYAAKDEAGDWKLENAWANELKKWKQQQTKWITFHFPPTFEFNQERAEKADAFVESFVRTLNIPDAKPFDFYVMNSEEELGRLFNLDYWLAYQTGFARAKYNRIFSAHGAEDNLHEFVHILYHPVKNHFLGEGIATYFGGVDGHTPYQETLREVSRDIYRNHPEVTFKNLYDGSFRYAGNQSPRYVAGAVVYQLVHEKKGVKGFREVEESDNTYESLIKTMAKVMRMKESKVEPYLTDYIRTYHLKETSAL